MRCIAVAAFGGALLASCASAPPAGRQASPAPVATQAPPPITVVSKGVGSRPIVFTQQKNGRKLYELRAASNVANQPEVGKLQADFTRPRIVFYQNKGGTLTAVSPTATVRQEAKNIVMSGGVRARTQDGASLRCDTLTYDLRSERLHGDGNVVLVTSDGVTLRGDRIDADVRLSEVNLHTNGKPRV
jgi:LPS export ABC transporter protein LptC